MNTLFYFVLGILFELVVVPLMDSIVSLITASIETIKSFLGVIINRNSMKVEGIDINAKQQTHAIGFCANDNYEESEDEENDI